MRYKNEPFWLFVTFEDHYVQTDIAIEEDYEYRWFTASADGTLCVRGSYTPEGHDRPPGYAWDGCTPKFPFLDMVWGTPDGVPGKNCKPKAYYASMMHDVLYQFGPGAGIKRSQADGLFYRMLKEQDFKLSFVYYLAVRIFGFNAWNRYREPGGEIGSGSFSDCIRREREGKQLA